MTDLLSELLAEKPWLLTDGATGTNLFARGLQHGDAPELWNLEEPEKIRAHYRDFIEAGSDIVLTNTFGGTANRLKLHKAEDRVYEINKAAAELLAAEIAESGRKIVNAGSVGPTGDLYHPLGPLTVEDGKNSFAAQMRGLKDGGADVAWVETISSEEELTAALDAADEVGLPAVCTLSFDTNGRTMMGMTPQRLVEMVHARPVRPLAFGGNCGTGASDLLVGLLSIAGKLDEGDVLVAKANCGIPVYEDGEIRYTGTPELMQACARLAVNLGARIIGGCCGTTPAHIRAMREALDAHTKGDAPDMPAIIAACGTLTGSTAELLGGGEGKESTRQRRGRRRN
ncbi:MAG: betaine--homocysteine S-methyltransferase [Nisaea sp.]|uniref:betaine--homocysteine S-methyltransferase n=1 Tax=Nisaea sp. TaxID=2024842 RepID=UPI001B2593CB|nr:betaine--homocysteine S-methyltransferase [Nisaea sp.]MBO6560300.1 betaine--homocysteine S-methyltransferase [Nisaea sp.]